MGGHRGRNPTVTNVTCTSADTEYTIVLPAGVKMFQAKCRDEDGVDTIDDIRLAWVTGKVATPTAPYSIIPKGMAYWEENVDIRDTATIFVASPASGAVTELLYWK